MPELPVAATWHGSGAVATSARSQSLPEKKLSDIGLL